MSFIKDTVVDEETPCWFEIWLLKVKDNVKSKFYDSSSLFFLLGQQNPYICVCGAIIYYYYY